MSKFSNPEAVLGTYTSADVNTATSLRGFNPSTGMLNPNATVGGPLQEDAELRLVAVVNNDEVPPLYFNKTNQFDATIYSYEISTIENGEIVITSGYLVAVVHDDNSIALTFARPSTIPSTGEPILDFVNNSATNYIISESGALPLGTSIGALTASNSGTPFGATPICFAEGTLIATEAGERAVERLAEGEMVRTASGDLRPVKWIGSMTLRPSRHRRPHEVNPVRIRAGAFGEGLPLRDLRVSPGHAIYVDGVLIPAGHLINGATIVQEEVETIRYFHVELESHDVILAEGLPCESYLDDGNRASFANAGENVVLHGRLDPKSWDDACAPMVAAGPQLTAVQQRLHARAEEMGWSKSDVADLVIDADGVAVAPLHQSGNRFWFSVPAATALTLRSNSGVLAHVMPGLGDGRMLGVAVSELRIDGVTIDLENSAFGAGFYPAERHADHDWRWTNGHATLARPIEAPAIVEVNLAMVAPSWMRRAPELKLVAQM